MEVKRCNVGVLEVQRWRYEGAAMNPGTGTMELRDPTLEFWNLNDGA